MYTRSLLNNTTGTLLPSHLSHHQTGPILYVQCRVFYGGIPFHEAAGCLSAQTAAVANISQNVVIKIVIFWNWSAHIDGKCRCIGNPCRTSAICAMPHCWHIIFNLSRWLGAWCPAAGVITPKYPGNPSTFPASSATWINRCCWSL